MNPGMSRFAVAAIGLLAVAQLASCASTMVTAPAKPLPAPVVQTVCPAIKTYSPEFQARLALEVQGLPDDSPLTQAMVDYGQLRAQVRACHGG